MFKPYSDIDTADSQRQPTTEAVDGTPPIVAPNVAANALPPWDPKAFILNSLNVPFITGKTRALPISGGGILIFLGVVFILPALFFAVPAFMNVLVFATRGTPTTAVITDMQPTENSGKSGTTYTYYVTFQYRDALERTFSHTQRLSGTVYYQLGIGQTAPIMYDRDNPSVAQLSGIYRDNTEYNSAISDGVMFLVPAILVASLGLMITTRTLRLQRSGQILKGVVLKADSAWNSKTGNTVTIQYQVIAPTGKPLVRTGSTIRNDLKGKPLPVRGTPVYVVYVNDKLYRML